MTLRPTVSRAQLEVLEAAAAGALVLSKRRSESYPHWRIQIDEDITKPVTRTADSLIARGLIAKGDQRSDGATYGDPTEAGRELLADFASREPHPTTPKDRA